MKPLKTKHQATIGLSVFSTRYLVTDRAVTQCGDVTHPCLVTTDNVCPLCPVPRCPLELETKVHTKVRNNGEGPY